MSSRRDFLKTGAAALLAAPAGRALSAPAAWFTHPLTLDASAAPAPVQTGFLRMGTARRPDGRVLTADSRSLLLDGQPYLPVMGEFHYTRYPAAEWRDELLKMKAGGLDLAATYIFWIHHEEIEGAFDWSGRRDLRRFVELCGAVGLPVVLRVGPWCHGEVRNGGLPDWLLAQRYKVRSDDPAYLAQVRRLYGEIAAQVKGLLWKDGGPVIGVQFENEFRGPAEHLLTLKRIGREAGLDTPLYTRTGWPELRTKMPLGELLPLFGSYADGFWDRSLAPMPGGFGEAFLFKLARNDAEVATDQLGRRVGSDTPDAVSYPYFCCEIGGGMERSYHRRIRLAPADVYASGLVKLGSGNNLQGYYMYHGGTNPEGQRTTLQESQATNYWNDVPVKSYDFQAPLGEFGQVNPHYHLLRRMHLFLRDFGPSLATMPAYLPDARPATPRDTAALRWAVRTDGASGYLFVSNYHRLQPMPAHPGVQFRLQLRRETLTLPDTPVTVPADGVFFWPFRLDLGGAELLYATAQPVCRVEDRDAVYFVFAQTAGVPAEFAFAPETQIAGARGTRATAAGRQIVRNIAPGLAPAVTLRAKDGKLINILLLDEPTSLACWKAPLAGRERLFVTPAHLVTDGDEVRLNATRAHDFTVAVLPAPAALKVNGKQLKGTPEGLWRRFTAPRPRVSPVKAVLEPVCAAGPARVVKKGSKDVAEAPTDEDFAQAAVWRVRLPARLEARRDLLLRVRYTGDVARFYLGDTLLTDNFYNGNPFDLGLTRHAPDIYRKALLLKVLPLRRDAPIYLADDARPAFGEAASVARLDSVEIIERQEVKFTAA